TTCNSVIKTSGAAFVECPVMGWSVRAPAPPAISWPGRLLLDSRVNNCQWTATMSCANKSCRSKSTSRSSPTLWTGVGRLFLFQKWHCCRGNVDLGHNSRSDRVRSHSPDWVDCGSYRRHSRFRVEHEYFEPDYSCD